MSGAVVTQPPRKSGGGRPVARAFTCDVCKLPIATGEPVLYAMQESGCGPYPGQCCWYTATAHADPCGVDVAGAAYQQRPCRGCGRVMRVRAHSRRSHCCSACRQADYRRRRDLADHALHDGRVIYRDELYWLTGPDQVSTS